MATVGEILRRKGTEIVGLPSSATVLDAAQLMNERGTGSVMVLDHDNLVGIFTERDVLRRVVAEQRDPATTHLDAVMTRSVFTCAPSATLDECRGMMSGKRIRHLPVVGPDGLCGMISSGDLLALQMDEQQHTIEELNRYVYDLR
jgi:CBS domain-containing protein